MARPRSGRPREHTRHGSRFAHLLSRCDAHRHVLLALEGRLVQESTHENRRRSISLQSARSRLAPRSVRGHARLARQLRELAQARPRVDHFARRCARGFVQRSQLRDHLGQPGRIRQSGH